MKNECDALDTERTRLPEREDLNARMSLQKQDTQRESETHEGEREALDDR